MFFFPGAFIKLPITIGWKVTSLFNVLKGGFIRGVASQPFHQSANRTVSAACNKSNIQLQWKMAWSLFTRGSRGENGNQAAYRQSYLDLLPTLHSTGAHKYFLFFLAVFLLGISEKERQPSCCFPSSTSLSLQNPSPHSHPAEISLPLCPEGVPIHYLKISGLKHFLGFKWQNIATKQTFTCIIIQHVDTTSTHSILHQVSAVNTI